MRVNRSMEYGDLVEATVILEVRKILIAKNEPKQYHSGSGWDFGN
jgi:hypothetical protein